MKKNVICFILSVFFYVTKSQPFMPDVTFLEVDKNVIPSAFEKIIDGKKTALYIIANDSGIVVKITNYGARVVSILMPDKNGKYSDICLGYSKIDDYIRDNMYLGATVGRYANRIANASFVLDSIEYKLENNNGKNSLHGGIKGFSNVVWDASQHGDTIDLTYCSPDMEEGFPGTLKVHLRYILNNENELVLQYSASTDKKTIVNLTNHSYFNLKGEGNGNILDHDLQLFAKKFTPVNKDLIPTGFLKEVKGSVFDFTSIRKIGERNDEKDEQLILGKGYDHNFVLDKEPGIALSKALRVMEHTSGRAIEIYTTEPGIQFYTGNFMNGTFTGKSGRKYKQRYGLAFEPQHFPDSPNRDEFPSVILNPGETYSQLSIFKFIIIKD